MKLIIGQAAVRGVSWLTRTAGASPPVMSDQDKRDLIARALETSEGRMALAQEMCNATIRRILKDRELR